MKVWLIGMGFMLAVTGGLIYILLHQRDSQVVALVALELVVIVGAAIYLLLLFRQTER